jgi:hypothetical protein
MPCTGLPWTGTADYPSQRPSQAITARSRRFFDSSLWAPAGEIASALASGCFRRRAGPPAGPQAASRPAATSAAEPASSPRAGAPSRSSPPVASRDLRTHLLPASPARSDPGASAAPHTPTPARSCTPMQRIVVQRVAHPSKPRATRRFLHGTLTALSFWSRILLGVQG